MQKIDSYSLIVDDVPCSINIFKDEKKFVPTYEILFPQVDTATKVVLDTVRDRLVQKVRITLSEVLDPKAIEEVKRKFIIEALEGIKHEFPELSEAKQKALAGSLVHDMLGLGKLELMISDPNLEEIVVNSSTEPVRVYHKLHGWLETTITLTDESQIYNYSSIIGRKVGRQITNLDPLMDAHLMTGDRVNATLFPISTAGNTITIRKFSRDPWTIVHLIDPKYNTVNKEIASLLWLAMEYELNILVAGGTASGKTSFLNALMPFIPSNQRIISIEDTRELFLPKYLHWVPLTTRPPNPEGKGKVSMLDLMVNALRMRPDRVVLGEIRRRREAEVLFEAMHTGHSVYSTLHAENAVQVKSRLTSPPIDLPEEMLGALHLILVQYRQRRLKIRRTYEVAEVSTALDERGKTTTNMDVLYKWNPKKDSWEKAWKSSRLFNEISMHTGMTDKEILENMDEKQKILSWMLKNNVRTLNTVGKTIAEYYNNSDDVLQLVSKNKKPLDLLGEELAKELNK